MNTDVHSPEARSRNMAAIRHKDTRPEVLLRKALHRRGYRYRLHDKGLPGTPDMVLRGRNAVIFMHGCFFHRHGCYRFRWPKQNEAEWREKIDKNAERDRRQLKELQHDYRMRSLIVWECALTGRQKRTIEDIVDLVDRWFSLKPGEPGYWFGSIEGHRK